ncbi:hypothetical protein JKY72_00370 [Candidatus Gracilibacteria bacterium]|nr:hypothetical protein [Candidatus Gracilibacteria bacterium]
MIFKKEVLETALRASGVKVSEAFAMLAKGEVKVTSAEVVVEDKDALLEKILSREASSVIAYSQLMSDINGLALLMLTREDALTLVDILNQREVGTTGVLMEIDRSAIKETLNILSNTQLTALSKMADENLGLGVPYMMPLNNLKLVLSKIKEAQKIPGDDSVIFSTTLSIAGHDISADLFLVFNKEAVEAATN